MNKMNKKIAFFILWSVLVTGTIFSNVLSTKAAVPNIVVQFQTQPLFNQANFAPGNTVTRSVIVTNNYTLAKPVALKTTNVVDANAMASQINMVIKTGSTVIYTGTLQGIMNAGEQSLTTLAGGATIQYDFSATFNPASGNQYQGKTIVFDFIVGFQAQNQGSITIIKKTVGGDGTFNFTGNLGQFNIQTVSGTAGKSFNNMAPGTYTITEPSQGGWDLTSLTCTDPNGDSVINVNNRNAVIKLAAGETVTCTFTNTKQGGNISGMKFNDLNRNGVKDANEPGLQGWTITLRNTGNNVIRTTTTDASGNYSFINLPAGSYKIREVHQKGWKRISKNPKAITVSGGSNITGTNFGNAQKKNAEKEDTETDDLRDD